MQQSFWGFRQVSKDIPGDWVTPSKRLDPHNKMETIPQSQTFVHRVELNFRKPKSANGVC
jgi:hypothetical protein